MKDRNAIIDTQSKVQVLWDFVSVIVKMFDERIGLVDSTKEHNFRVDVVQENSSFISEMQFLVIQIEMTGFKYANSDSIFVYP